MKNKRNMGANAALNVIRTSLALLCPLLSYYRAMHVLGVEGMGKVAFSHSIVGYFSLLAMLGVGTYAVREGARRRENTASFRSFADEILTINLIMATLSYLLLGLALLVFGKLWDYRMLILIQSLSILFTTLGIEWVNAVFEDYLFITIQSIATRLLSLVLVFLLVRSERDYYLYVWITVFADAAVCLSNQIYCRRYVRLHLTARPNIGTHARPLLILFANALTISVYMNFDVTMLGWMKNDYYVGLYDQAVKPYNGVKQLLAAVFTVAIARLTLYAGKEDFASYKRVYSRLWGSLSLLLIPTVVGLLCLAREIVLIMGGAAFLPAVPSLRILALALLFAIFGGLVTSCLNVTLSRERENLIATLLGAALNVGLNFLFIPWLAQNGAAITTVLAELFVFLFCWLRVPDRRRYLEQTEVLRALRDSLLGSLGIVAVSLAAHALLRSPLAVAAVTVLGSVAVYAALLRLLRDPFFLDAVGMLRKKLHI